MHTGTPPQQSDSDSQVPLTLSTRSRGQVTGSYGTPPHYYVLANPVLKSYLTQSGIVCARLSPLLNPYSTYIVRLTTVCAISTGCHARVSNSDVFRLPTGFFSSTMWLLSTDRAELHFMPDTAAVTGGYAILSHRWEGSEQSFQDLQRIRDECRPTGANPRNFVSPKIRECCILAKKYGYFWIWVDSCCINKESSTELSEAINSMFDWYTQSEVCFAYLADVPSNCVLASPHSEFRRSEWHKRGWTLQELIAPAIVIFVSGAWDVLGNRCQLASLLEDISGVPARVLAGLSTPSEYSIYVRMSWASRRRTTRLEDEAYCLLGLFGVNMPTIYGEGRRAFQRLQLEIMADSVDASLFAWGTFLPQAAHHELRLHSDHSNADSNHLLAPSPSCFELGRPVGYVPALTAPLQPYTQFQRSQARLDPAAELRWNSGPFARSELPRFVPTAYGVECHFPIIELTFLDLLVMVLLCQTMESGGYLGLLLHQSRRPMQDGLRGLYMTGATLVRSTAGSAWEGQCRMISLGADLTNLQVEGKIVQVEWRTVHVVPYIRRACDISDNPFSRLSINRMQNMPFSIPRWLIARLKSLGFSFRIPPHSADGSSMRVGMSHTSSAIHICIEFGSCDRIGSISCRTPKLWAQAFIFTLRRLGSNQTNTSPYA